MLGVKEVHKAVPLTRAQKYARALKACKKLRSRHKRSVCMVNAKKKYGPLKKKAKKSGYRPTRGGRR